MPKFFLRRPLALHELFSTCIYSTYHLSGNLYYLQVIRIMTMSEALTFPIL